MSGDTLLQLAELRRWAEDNSYVNEYGTRCYGDFVCHIMNLFDPRSRCTHGVCGWVAPYGFVPEAECPIHD